MQFQENLIMIDESDFTLAGLDSMLVVKNME